jgi:site-specific DNA-adenine methylase
MRKNYGMPYQGSKNRIAEDIIDFLPKRKVLVDLFGGGGAISDCASQS